MRKKIISLNSILNDFLSSVGREFKSSYKRMHMIFVLGGFRMLANNDAKGLYERLVENQRNKINFEEYSNNLNKIFEIYNKLSILNKKLLFWALILHDIYYTESEEDNYLHGVFGAKIIEDKKIEEYLIKKGFSEQDLIVLKKLVKLHGSSLDLGVQVLPKDCLELIGNKELTDLLLLLDFLDASGKVNGDIPRNTNDIVVITRLLGLSKALIPSQLMYERMRYFFSPTYFEVEEMELELMIKLLIERDADKLLSDLLNNKLRIALFPIFKDFYDVCHQDVSKFSIVFDLFQHIAKHTKDWTEVTLIGSSSRFMTDRDFERKKIRVREFWQNVTYNGFDSVLRFNEKEQKIFVDIPGY